MNKFSILRSNQPTCPQCILLLLLLKMLIIITIVNFLFWEATNLPAEQSTLSRIPLKAASDFFQWICLFAAYRAAICNLHLCSYAHMLLLSSCLHFLLSSYPHNLIQLMRFLAFIVSKKRCYVRRYVLRNRRTLKVSFQLRKKQEEATTMFRNVPKCFHRPVELLKIWSISQF